MIEKRPKLVEKNTAVVLEPHESRINEFMQVLGAVSKERQEQQKIDLEKRQKEFKKVSFLLKNIKLFFLEDRRDRKEEAS